MSLQKGTISLSVQGGLDTKTDVPNVNQGNFLDVQNAVYTKSGGFQKREGYGLESNEIYSGGNLSSGVLAAYSGDATLLSDGDKFYSKTEVDNKLVDIGSWRFCQNESNIIDAPNSSINYAYTYSEPSMAVIGDTSIHVHRTNAGLNRNLGKKFIIRDRKTGSTIRELIIDGNTPDATVVPASFQPMRVEACNGIYVIIGSDNSFTTLKAYCYDPVAKVMSSVISIHNTAKLNDTRLAYRTTADKVYIAFADTSTTTTYIAYITPSLSTPTYVKKSQATAANVMPYCINLEGVNVKLFLAQGSTVYHGLYSADLSSTIQYNTVTSYGGGIEVLNLTSIATSSSNSLLLTEYNNTAGFIEITASNINTSGAVVGSFAYLSYSGKLLSDLIEMSNGKYAIALMTIRNTTSYKGTAYLLELEPLVNGILPSSILSQFEKEETFGNQIGISLTPSPYFLKLNTLSQLQQINDELYFTAPAMADIVFSQMDSASDIFFDSLIKNANIKQYKTTLSVAPNAGSGINTFSQESNIMSGAVAGYYSNKQIQEQGFLNRPLINKIVVDGLGTLQAGTYSACIVFKYVDESGNIFRSAPSDIVVKTVGAGSGIRLYYTAISFTNKNFLTVEAYISNVNGSTMYLINQNVNPIQLNYPTAMVANSLRIDVEPQGGEEALYTTSGGLEVDSAPPSKFLVEHGRRVFGLSSLENSIFYSQLFERGEPVKFSDAFKIPLTNRGGTAKGLASLDSHLIIFKESAVFTLIGQGPNNQGQQDDFQDPQFITADAGLKDINSITVTPFGIIFKSHKGIYLLNRSLSMEYIGAPVEQYNSDTIISSILLEDKNEVRFYTDTNRLLCFDYFHKKWAVHYLPGSVASATNHYNHDVRKNIPLHVEQGGDVYTTREGVYSDEGQDILMKITSAWINVAGIQGFQRFYKMFILGKFTGTAQTLKVSFAYDHDDTWVDEVTIDSSSLPSTDPYSVEIRPKIQKCKTFKYKIEEITSDGYFEISNISMEIGMKQGLIKQSVANRFGAS